MESYDLSGDYVKENEGLKEIIEVAKQINSGLDINHITKNVNLVINSKYNPSFVAFILQNDIDDPTPILHIYNGLRYENRGIEFDSIHTLIKFFETQEFNQISFDQFCNSFNDDGILNSLKDFSPEFVIPLKSYKTIRGMFIQGKKKDNTNYTTEDIQFCVNILSFASISLENAILYREATIDRMTKLFTHHQFLERLDNEIKKGQRYENVFSLIMFDIDDFKKINDAYGHLQGDIIIKEIAKILMDSTRLIDMPARYGGEEFIVLLPEINIEQAFIAAERLRKKIESFDFPGKGGPYKITISLGVAEFNKEKINYSDDFINLVDQALYISKNNGKNKVTKI